MIKFNHHTVMVIPQNPFLQFFLKLSRRIGMRVSAWWYKCGENLLALAIWMVADNPD